MVAVARTAVAIWLAALCLGALLVWQSRFTADMSFFLPTRPSSEQQILVDQLREGSVTRLLMIAIAGRDAAQRAALSRELQARLARRSEFATVRNGEAASVESDRDFLFAHRYLLSPAVTAERFTVAGLQEAIGASIDLLASPLGMLTKPLLSRDPTGELLALLLPLQATAQPNQREGVWASRDGQRALLLAQTAALGSDTDGDRKSVV